MRRAFVGFSTPIGYDYGNPLKDSHHPEFSSPNPVLFGSTGLLVLFDEIWFPSEHFCPKNMRNLDYVRFLDNDRIRFPLNWSSIDSLAGNLPENLHLSINDMFDDGYGAIGRYAVAGARVDNHTSGLPGLGDRVMGNPTYMNLVRDLATIEEFYELDLTPILNPLTAKYLVTDRAYLESIGSDKFRAIQVAQGILTIKGLRDLATADGPYHPVIDDLRSSKYLSDFREWMDEPRSTWDNRSNDDIVEELNNEIRAFNTRVLDRAVQSSFTREVIVNILTSSILSIIAGASPIHNVLKYVRRNKDNRAQRWQAYCAQAQFKVLSA